MNRILRSARDHTDVQNQALIFFFKAGHRNNLGGGSGRGVDHVEAAEQDQQPADLFENEGAFGLFVPVHVFLHDLRGGSGQDNDGTVADAVHRQQTCSVDGLLCAKLEGDPEHGGHVGKGAGAESNAENEAEQKSH